MPGSKGIILEDLPHDKVSVPVTILSQKLMNFRLIGSDDNNRTFKLSAAQCIQAPKQHWLP
jgi:hypothetical protein